MCVREREREREGESHNLEGGQANSVTADNSRQLHSTLSDSTVHRFAFGIDMADSFFLSFSLSLTLSLRSESQSESLSGLSLSELRLPLLTLSSSPLSVGNEGPLIIAVFGVSPKELPFAFSDQQQTDTTKDFQTPVLCPFNPNYVHVLYTILSSPF